MSQKHYIKRQLFELRIGPGTDAFGIQQSLSDYFWKEMAPRLEELFDRLVGQEEVVSIDKLVIDLGPMSIDELTSSDGLQKLIRSLELSLSGEITVPGRNVKRKTKKYSTWQQWLYFLIHGSMPWSSSAPDKKWWQEVLEQFIIEASCVETLRSILQHNPAILKRLVWQHSEEFLTSLVALYTGHSQKELMAYKDQIVKCFREISKSSHTKKPPGPLPIWDIPTTEYQELATDHFWQFVLSESIIRDQSLTSSELILKFISRILVRLARSNGIRILQHHRALLPKYPVVHHFLIEVEQSLGQDPSSGDTQKPGQASDKKDNPDKLGWGEKIKEIDWESDGSHIDEPVHGMEDFFKREQSKPQLDDPPGLSDPEEEWYLQQAGVVLLHPFLLQFFKRLQLVQDKAFKDSIAQNKAIHLLYYLATGNTKPQEYLLTLPKLLCGLPLNAPVRKHIKLSKKEKRESNKLINVVIDHWEVLGNTSIKGLREGFFEREGKLSQTGNGWQLWVEQKSIDVLLDRKPWNLGIVKLPWMNEVLRVEWR